MATWLVTGGTGFIGANSARTLVERNHTVVLVDNLSRVTAQSNLDWLHDHVPRGWSFVKLDVRDAAGVDGVFREHGPFDVVLHLAGQVAVTSSVVDPRHDLETNVFGTYNLLEATRRFSPAAAFINASTNKVYGALEHHRTSEQPTRYVDLDAPAGIAETQPLDPCTPYGCSKAAADFYTLDHARIYGLKALTLRQSCIYGPRQFGVEDQGWVAWFAMAARLDLPLTIYGDGKQVRDLLHVDDLVALYLLAADRAEACLGRAYNVEGGPANTLSLLELIERLALWSGAPLDPSFAEARHGDQRVFVADSSRALEELGWSPQIGIDAGLPDLLGFVDGHSEGARTMLPIA